jgi:hypothetical protein
MNTHPYAKFMSAGTFQSETGAERFDEEEQPGAEEEAKESGRQTEGDY